jgi:hypothetical protein
MLNSKIFIFSALIKKNENVSQQGVKVDFQAWRVPTEGSVGSPDQWKFM